MSADSIILAVIIDVGQLRPAFEKVSRSFVVQKSSKLHMMW